jgi:hypothetical protein
MHHFFLNTEIPPDLCSGAGRMCTRNALHGSALLQTQSTTIINDVTFCIMLVINPQLNLGISGLLAHANPDATIAEI